MKKTLIVVTSYKRLQMLNNLLISLKDFDISVYDDRSDYIVERHNVDFVKLKKHYGKIEVKSKVGVGTAFIIHLPIVIKKLVSDPLEVS